MGARRRRGALGVLIPALLVAGCNAAEREASGDLRGPTFVEAETQLLETTSPYSHIRVKQEGTLRSLWFVQDDQGREIKETAIDLARPQDLAIPYTRAMFVSHLLLPTPPERCLLVGLGGGAMVQFLEHHFPRTEVDAVEIDPVVVQIADEWFGTRSGPRTRIHTEDGFVYVERALEQGQRWDVVYMDAFLKPAEDTDARGLQLRLKTLRFFEDLGRLLRKGGLIVFNMLRGPDLDGDLRTIQRAFPHVRVVLGYGYNVVVAASFTAPPSDEELERRARQLDAQGLGFSAQKLAESLRKGR